MKTIKYSFYKNNFSGGPETKFISLHKNATSKEIGKHLEKKHKQTNFHFHASSDCDFYGNWSVFVCPN